MKISKIVGNVNAPAIWVEMQYMELNEAGERVLCAEQPEDKVRFRLRNPENRSEMVRLSDHIDLLTFYKLQAAAEMDEEALKNLSIGDMVKARASAVARMVVEWEGFTDDDGKPLPFNYNLLMDMLALDSKILVWLEGEIAKLNTGAQPAQAAKAEVVEHVKKKSRR